MGNTLGQSVERDKAADSCSECVDIASQILNAAFDAAEVVDPDKAVATVQCVLQRKMIEIISACPNQQECMDSLGLVALAEPTLSEQQFVEEFVLVCSRFVQLRHRLDIVSVSRACWVPW